MPTIPVPTRAVEPVEKTPTPADPMRLRLLDGALLVAFAALTFLLGVFPLKDVDFWWHLRTGDLIRQTGEVPRTDPYTYTVSDRAWIDLHWGFQLLISYGYEFGQRFDRGGVVFLNLAKCVVTTIAVLLLVTARRKGWPLWAMVTAWLPALVLLGGRMYIRPETMTLLYISIYLAVLFRWERIPWLGFALPVVQIFWVNTQGLFVFGPILLGFALLDGLIRPGVSSPGRRSWMRTALPVTLLVGLACLANPYGLRGMLFPLTDLLLGTMSDPIFKERIAELSSISKLIDDSAGYPHFMLIVHLSVVTLGGLSFLLPLLWQGFARIADHRSGPVEPAPTEPTKKSRRKRSKAESAPDRRRGRAPKNEPAMASGWSLSPFRLMLYLAFTALSWQATRNSHQFAAIVGTITAWNFGEWAAAVIHRRAIRGKDGSPKLWPRVVALVTTVAVLVSVASGGLYAASEEGRTIGLGEEPAWFPHRAVEFAGSEGLPGRFLGFHIGHDALFIYHHGPDRKVYVDPRLEVMGADQFRAYTNLSEAISGDDPGARWRSAVEQAGNPVILADNEFTTRIVATLLIDPGWRCLWFDEIASVFATEADAEAGGFPEVDFLGRHFGTQDDPSPPTSDAEWRAATRSLSKLILLFLEQRNRPDLAATLTPLGLARSREARRRLPDDPEPWAFAAAMELGRLAPPSGPPGSSRPDLRRFDPVEDLHASRVAAFARGGLNRDPGQQVALSALLGLALMQGMDEMAVPLLERAIARLPRTNQQAVTRESYREQLSMTLARLGRGPRIDVTNVDRIEASVSALLASGRAESAVALLESQYPAAERDWPMAEKIASLLMHLGFPERAREAWLAADDPPDLAFRQARVAATHYVEDHLDLARESYRLALEDDPDLFDAKFGLALVEHDAGRAGEALEAARTALELAPNDGARAACRAIIRAVEPYAVSRRGA